MSRPLWRRAEMSFGRLVYCSSFTAGAALIKFARAVSVELESTAVHGQEHHENSTYFIGRHSQTRDETGRSLALAAHGVVGRCSLRDRSTLFVTSRTGNRRWK